MSERSEQIRKRAVLVILLALPVSVYLGAILLSGELKFDVLKVIGPKEVVQNSDGTFDTLAYRVPDFSFINQFGDTITREDMDGKIYVASFFFTTCPTICPAMNHHLKQVHDRLVSFKDIYFLSHTIDVEYDSVEVLYNYAYSQNKLNLTNFNKWYFVTGEQEDIFSMADSYFLAAQEDSLRPEETGGYLHSSQVVLVDWEGRIRSRVDDNGNIVGAYETTRAEDIDVLIDDLRVLAKEYREVKMNR